MKNAIDLDAIESEWDKYQSDGPVDDVLASLNISLLIAELRKMYAREDELLNVLQNVRRGLDDAKWIILEKEIRSRYEWLTILRKIEDSANDAYK